MDDNAISVVDYNHGSSYEVLEQKAAGAPTIQSVALDGEPPAIGTGSLLDTAFDDALEKLEAALDGKTLIALLSQPSGGVQAENISPEIAGLIQEVTSFDLNKLNSVQRQRVADIIGVESLEKALSLLSVTAEDIREHSQSGVANSMGMESLEFELMDEARQDLESDLVADRAELTVGDQILDYLRINFEGISFDSEGSKNAMEEIARILEVLGERAREEEEEEERIALQLEDDKDRLLGSRNNLDEARAIMSSLGLPQEMISSLMAELPTDISYNRHLFDPSIEYFRALAEYMGIEPAAQAA